MDATSNLVMTQITSSAMFVYILQVLKKSKWFKILSDQTPKLNRAASMVLALVGTIGVTYVWNPSSRTLTIALPTLAGAAVAVWHWAQHYAMQEMIYQATSNKSAPSKANANP